MKKVISNILYIHKICRDFRLQIFVLPVFVLFESLGSVAIALCLRNLIDSAISKDDQFITNIILVAAILIICLVSGFVASKMRPYLDMKISNKLQEMLFEKILNSNIQTLGQMHSGDFITRMISDTGKASLLFSDHIPTFLAMFGQVLAALVFIFAFSPLLGVGMMVTIPLFFLAGLPAFLRLRRYNKMTQECLSQVQSFAQESYQNIKVVKTFDNNGIIYSKFRGLLSKMLNIWRKRCTLDAFVNTLLKFVYYSIYLAGIIIGILMIRSGEMTVGTAVAFFQLVMLIQAPIFMVIRLIPSVMASSVSSDRICEIFDLPQDAVPNYDNSIDVKGSLGVSVSDAYFAYNKSSVGRTILNGVNLTIKPGTFTAIIGLSGQGKTTLFYLLLAFLELDSGSITLFDESGQTFPVSVETRSLISYIPQGNSIISGTVRENLCIGGMSFTDEQLEAALEAADALTFVKKLPQALDTFIGERGVGVSEGQVQRITIARGLLRKPHILLMDESTSALDEPTENVVLKNVREYLRESTIIMITHRMKAAEICDDKFELD